ncbi:polygalacturonase inhibitor-like [Iris pallida]|uniref:Polygalacturonase inhibitor-like n=1 Tax=Iris pallida TaxID=29817 RepID=A0AAX6GVG1_IRIPA|nr:polygalacturonase inhibitor-like [Iris pallida]KAJ6832298.1 polygalacturonase inhibitor-like [Iris pallida]
MGISTILSLTLLFLAFTLSSAASCTKSDVAALNAFKNSFPANTFPNSWDSSDNCCFYDGVGCDKGRVTSLLFTSDQDDFDHLPVLLNGSLPASIGDLSALESISIQLQPNLVGPIPNNWANLKKMQYFTIYNTSISGHIPSFISQYTNLLELEINYCKLITGTIPASLGNLANLQVIALDDNNLSGTIPGNLFSKLKSTDQAELGLSNNKLTGSIPQSFATIKWKNLDVSNNMLCGQIPKGGNYVPADGSGFANNKCLCGSPLPACK